MEFVIAIPAGPRFDPRITSCLASLRAQNVKVKAALCDVSQDQRCIDLAESYSDIIDYTRHGPDLGQSSAINEGWRAISGDIYGWLNVDDYLAPHALERVKTLFAQHPDIDVIYGQSLILEGKELIGLHSEVRPINPELYKTNIISQPSCFVRAKALFEVGLLNEELHYTMDWDLWVRLYESGAKFHYVPDVLSKVSWDEHTKTSEFNLIRYREIIQICRRHESWLSSQRTALSFILHHAAQSGWAKPLARLILSVVRKKHNIPERRWRSVMDPSHETKNTPVHLDIPLFHYGVCNHFNVELDFKGSSPRDITVGERKLILSNDDRVSFPAQIVPGKIEPLNIGYKQGQSSDLLSITLEGI